MSESGGLEWAMSSASSLVLSFRNALGVPSTKVPVDFTTLACYVLPPMAFYLVVAVLAVTPHTHPVRVALWPVIALLAWRAAASVDMSFGKHERKFLDINLVVSMLSIVLRSLHWTLAKEPLVRHLRPRNEPKSIVLDALDLASNLRGLGWEWSRGLYVPRETRPTNRIAFVFYTCLSAIAHALLCSILHRAILTLVSVGGGSIPEESSIFDETLPFLVKYLRASIISACTAFAIYSLIQTGYDLFTMVAILFLGQDPAQWPPIFDAPWLSTSLSEFWGRRWHQWVRHTFLVVGGYPLSFVFGRVGLVFGAFLASAVYHHIMLLAVNDQTETWGVLIGFGIMAPGVVSERVFRQLTGKRVGGVVGWVWTMAWLVLWGNVMVEGFARGGLFGCASSIDSALPVRVLVERWVANFDARLHTL